MASRLIAQTDARGKTTTFTYDGLNRLMELIDARGGLTRFAYDGNGNLLRVTDARGNTTSHTYDVMDRLASRTDPVNATETFSYDGNGNLTQHIDRKGQVATFGYDPVNRRTSAVYADASVTFTYDAVGRLIIANDTAGGTIANQYDTLDRLTSQVQPLGTISYQYDALGRRTQMQAPGVAAVFYGYDAASRLTTMTQAPLSPVTIDYDAVGRRTKLTLPNQVSTEYQYDAASRLTALIYSNALGPLGDLSYQYDAAGNRPGVGGSFARTLLPDAVATATYDAANRQLGFGNRAATYDASGNMTALTDPFGPTMFTGDARNRLRTLSRSGMTAAFVYDALGRRTSKTVNDTVTQILSDGVDDIQESGTGSATSYLRTLTVDETLQNSRGEFYLADALGSVLALTSAAGAIQTTYTYEPYGRASVEGSQFNSFDFAGRENDGTGLLYYRARYYSPALARFTAEDPISIGSVYSLRRDASTASFGRLLWTSNVLSQQGFHDYAYANNNPLFEPDALGYGWFSGVAGALIGGLTRGSGVFGPHGTYATIGAAAFGAAGAVAGAGFCGLACAVAGGFAGGFIGGKIGGVFDPPCAGQLNCREPIPPPLPPPPTPCGRKCGYL